jgi:hypothetical protein
MAIVSRKSTENITITSAVTVATADRAVKYIKIAITLYYHLISTMSPKITFTIIYEYEYTKMQV